jgi:Xaa-Pro aminopeptidase
VKRPQRFGARDCAVVLVSALLAGCAGQAQPAGAAAPAAAWPDFCGTDLAGIPAARERFAIDNAIVREKLDTALLPAMRAHGIDMWIVLDRENNDEPMHTILGGGFSGVRAAFIFFDRGAARPERIYFGSHEQPANSVIAQSYDVKQYYGYSNEGLTPLLREAVHSRKPKKIGVNTSATLPEADGLTVGLRDFLAAAVGPDYARRLASAELLVRDFRTNRTALETRAYTDLLQWTARWQCEALSDTHVTVGKTTAEDIAWWLQDRALKAGVTGSGTPRVVRSGDLLPLNAPDMPIEPGDIISIDGGLQYLSFATDIKRAAYVLKPGESAPPASVVKAWEDTLRFADVYASSMRAGRIGHEVWSGLMQQVEQQGYVVAYPDAGGRATTASKPEIGVYGHSVGNVAHDIGARIASDLPFAYGDRVRFPLVTPEWVSIEFHVSTPIPEWNGKTWYARYEETAQITDRGAAWMIPPQSRLLVISGARGRTTN